MNSRQAFFQRLSASLIIPISILPLAAILLAIGDQAGIASLEAAGLSLIRTGLPLLFAIGIGLGYTDSDGMGALSAVAGFLVLTAVAGEVAGEPGLNVGVLGGILSGAVSVWAFNRVQNVRLPEYLGLFSGKRMGPLVAALLGVPLGFLLGSIWPALYAGILSLGKWMYGAGGIGVFVYGAVLRLLIPTGLHHILIQLVDYQLGGWIDPQTGALLMGEYVRFLAGDPSAGRILSGFFITCGFAPVGAALAMIHEARPEQRRKVAGLMTTGILTAVLLGITEPVEFAFIFASPVLFGLHVVLAGFASLLAYMLKIHLGGYALSMAVINWHLQQNGWLLLPLGLAFTAIYYVSFRLVIRWLRPPVLGQVPEADSAPKGEETHPGEGPAFLQALGGASNIQQLDACMTRLRLKLADPGALDRASLDRLGAHGVVQKGGDVQVVLGPQAGDVVEAIRRAMADEVAEAPTVTLLSPLTGRVVPLEEVPDPVFADRIVGDGVAVEARQGNLVAPASGRIAHVSSGGHAVGMVTSEGLELLIHVGIDTIELRGEGFHLSVTEGQEVKAGDVLGRFEVETIDVWGKSLVSPVLVTNPDRIESLTVLATGDVSVRHPLLKIRLKD